MRSIHMCICGLNTLNATYYFNSNLRFRTFGHREEVSSFVENEAVANRWRRFRAGLEVGKGKDGKIMI
jgi:hypothetical protein